MEKPEDLIQKLNVLLDSDHIDLNEFDCLIKLLKEQVKTDVKFIDFEFYNEVRMEEARNHKLAKLEKQDFEAAAEFREIEWECLKYIKIKSEYHIEKSQFYYEKDFVFYFCMGNAKNDAFIKSRLQ